MVFKIEIKLRQYFKWYTKSEAILKSVAKIILTRQVLAKHFSKKCKHVNY